MDRGRAPGAARHRLAVRAARRFGRSLTPVVAAAVLLMAPAAAQAAFTAASASSLTASTYSVPAPGSLSATISCSPSARQGTVTVSSYGQVFRATDYRFTITAPDGSSSSTTTTSPTPVLTQSSSSAGNRTYTVAVEALVGTWVGATLTQSYPC